MKYNETSNYPKSIDPIIFFSDVDIPNLPTMNEYQSLVANRKYDEANTHMDNAPVHGYVASLFNMIEHRIRAVQEFILSGDYPANRETNSSTEPPNPSSTKFKETIWVGGTTV